MGVESFVMQKRLCGETRENLGGGKIETDAAERREETRASKKVLGGQREWSEGEAKPS